MSTSEQEELAKQEKFTFYPTGGNAEDADICGAAEAGIQNPNFVNEILQGWCSGCQSTITHLQCLGYQCSHGNKQIMANISGLSATTCADVCLEAVSKYGSGSGCASVPLTPGGVNTINPKYTTLVCEFGTEGEAGEQDSYGCTSWYEARGISQQNFDN